MAAGVPRRNGATPIPAARFVTTDADDDDDEVESADGRRGSVMSGRRRNLHAMLAAAGLVISAGKMSPPVVGPGPVTIRLEDLPPGDGLRTGQWPGDRRRPMPVRCGSCRHARKSSWCSAPPLVDPKPLEWQQHSFCRGEGRRQRNAATGAVTTGPRYAGAGDAPPPRPGRPATICSTLRLAHPTICSSWNKSASGRPARAAGTQQQPELRAGCRRGSDPATPRGVG